MELLIYICILQGIFAHATLVDQSHGDLKRSKCGTIGRSCPQYGGKESLIETFDTTFFNDVLGNTDRSTVRWL